VTSIPILSPLARFLVIGAMAVGLNLVLFWIFVGQLGWNYLLATVAVFVAGNLFGYTANRRFTFESTSRRGPEIARWYLVMAVSLGVNLTAMAVLVGGLGINYLVASLVLSLALALVNFAAHDRFTFRYRTSSR